MDKSYFRPRRDNATISTPKALATGPQPLFEKGHKEMVKLNEIAKLAVKKNDDWRKPVEQGPEIDKAAGEFVNAAKKILKEAGSVESELDSPRGHKELYSLLGKMWGLVQAVDQSPARLEVIARVKAELKAEKIGYDEKAPFSKLLLKFSFRGKRRQLAHVYGRVFDQAKRKNIAPDALADEIVKAEGVQKFARTERQQADEDKRKSIEKARITAMARLVNASARASGVVVDWAEDPLKAGAGEAAQFAVFVGVPRADGRYGVALCADVGQSQETTLIKWLLTAYKKASTEEILAQAEALATQARAEEAMIDATGSVEVAQ